MPFWAREVGVRRLLNNNKRFQDYGVILHLGIIIHVGRTVKKTVSFPVFFCILIIKSVYVELINTIPNSLSFGIRFNLSST